MNVPYLQMTIKSQLRKKRHKLLSVRGAFDYRSELLLLHDFAYSVMVM